MTLNFTLNKKVKNSKKHSLFIRYDHNSKKTMFSCGIRVEENNLNFVRKNGVRKIDKGSPLKKTFPSHHKTNNFLQKKYNDIWSVIVDQETRGLGIEPREIKEAFKKKYFSSERIRLWEGVDLIIQKNKGIMAKNTIDNYQRLKNLLVEYGKNPLTEDVNISFFNDLKSYLVNKKKFLNSTVDKTIKEMKSTLKKLEEEGYSVCNDYKKIKRNKPKPFINYLERNEIEMIKSADLSEKLSKIRDVFLLQCYTGLRYSDLSRVKRDMIDSNNILRTRALKNKNSISIPLSDSAKEILNKYKYHLPIPNSIEYNKLIHEICQKSGLDRVVETSEGEMKLWEHATSHIAKKTFITHSLDVLTPKEVSQVTGTSLDVIIKHYIANSDIVKIGKKMRKLF